MEMVRAEAPASGHLRRSRAVARLAWWDATLEMRPPLRWGATGNEIAVALEARDISAYEAGRNGVGVAINWPGYPNETVWPLSLA